ncbi:MAG: hypothetical protein NC420_15875 [Eubacterium sp.]|nr:hypothetical protein [Eubacterium sp.]MCM1219250.1 hypothetical protein [Lachnospiraceae bacterium]MCM1241032.1 hypothetical protein [Lachnospiraceae bacterium]
MGIKEEKEQKQKKWSFDRVIGVINTAGMLISLRLSLSNNDMPQRGFNAFVLILITFIIFMMGILGHSCYKARKEYRSNLDELDKYAESQKRAIDGYGYWREQFRKEYIEGMKKNLLGKVKAVSFAVITVAAICMIFPQNTQAFWNGVLGVEASEEVNASSDDAADANAREPEAPAREERDMRWRFVLDDPTCSFAQESMLDQVFFKSDKEFAEWVDYVQQTVALWKDEQKEGVDHTTVKDDEGNTFFDYTASEDDFKDRVNDASRYIYYDEWLAYAPHSYDYDTCIAGREKLNKVEVDGMTGCQELWWKLANDYLYYAKEYERQTENADAILSYYTNSIYCCMEALKYSMSKEEYNEIYHFMSMRYHDICRNECIIPQEYKIIASNIFSILVETDVLRTVE